MAKLLIIDTFGLIFRAYYAYPLLSTADGRPTGAVYGFINMLLKAIEIIQPDHLVCSLESTTPTFRHQLLAEYKANRKEADPDMKIQIADIITILQTLGIQIIQKDGFEADDVIGSYATQYKSQYEDIKIITGDRDLLQLLQDNICVMMPGKTFSDFVEFNREKFEDKYKIKLENYVLYKSLIGDASDNIKGIPGIGPKTAEKIVSQYDSIEEILANLDQFPPKVAESITENKDLWLNFYKLCEIDKTVPVELTPEQTHVKNLKVHKLRNLVDEYELTSLKNKITKFIDNFEKKYNSFGLFDFEEDTSKTGKHTELEYIDSPLNEIKFASLNPNSSVDQAKEAYVLNTAKGLKLGNGKEFGEIQPSEIYNFVIKHNITKFIGFEFKSFIKLLQDSGIENIDKFDFVDLRIAWYILRSDIKFEGLNELVKYLNLPTYAELHEKSITEIKEANYETLFKLETELQNVVVQMEYTGIKCSIDQLNLMEERLKSLIEETKQKIYDFVGHEFNPASTKELGHILFEVLNLPVFKKNKTGYSTDDSTLSKLEGMSDLIPLIKQFRQYSKILSTYVLGLKASIQPDGKIHTTFNQTQVATGRLSSINPNLQNLPTSDLGAEIKQTFTPSNKNRIFVSIDYSQIDLRILAFESQDNGLLTAIRNDEDIHTSTAKTIFEKTEVTKEERNFAKTINFGIVYGMEPYGLSQALGIDQKSAKEFIDKYFERFPGVRQYFDRITKELDDHSYVQTFLGRKRYFNNWKQTNGFQRKMLFREAINMPIQGGTAEVIKMAMIEVYKYLKSEKLDAQLVLQIHDEIIIEMDEKDFTSEFQTKITELMCKVYDITVPLKASIKSGKDLSFKDAPK